MATSTKNQDKLALLRDILLPEEHKALEELSRRVLAQEAQGLEQREMLKRLELEMSHQLEKQKNEIASSLREDFLNILKKEIGRDPEAVAEILAPLTPILIKRVKEEKRAEKLQKRSAPFRLIQRRWKSFTGLFKTSSHPAKSERELRSANIEQLLLIDRKSGNLKASFKEKETMDASKISVICGLINDHILKHDLGKDQHLGVIPYGPYRIHMQSFIKHFVAVVISGRKEMQCKEQLQDIIFSFYYQFMAKNLELMNEAENKKETKKIIDRSLLDKAMNQSFKKEAPQL
jgi:hypothetical protein